MSNSASLGKRKKDTKKDMDRKDTMFAIGFLTVVVIGIFLALLYSSGALESLTCSGGDRKVDVQTGKVADTVREYDPSEITENGNVSVPGYEKLELKAGKTKQKVYLLNPKENTCYFKLSLMLEDGTVIWQSDLLEPGMAFDRIELNQGLEKGTYEHATLQYDCYSLADKRELNGSRIQLILEVR